MPIDPRMAIDKVTAYFQLSDMIQMTSLNAAIAFLQISLRRLNTIEYD